jgi:hypothetical protein
MSPKQIPAEIFALSQIFPDFMLVMPIAALELYGTMIAQTVHRIAIACFFLGLFPTIHAQTLTPASASVGKSNQPQKHIRVQAEFIDVSLQQFTELMNGDKPAANDGELRKQVAQLVKDGNASVVKTLLVTALSGEKARTESSEEIIYPTEYEHAVLADPTNANDKEGTTKTTLARIDPTIGPMPVGFEPRNVGPDLEIEATISKDEKMIHLPFSLQIV